MLNENKRHRMVQIESAKSDLKELPGRGKRTTFGSAIVDEVATGDSVPTDQLWRSTTMSGHVQSQEFLLQCLRGSSGSSGHLSRFL